MANCCLYDAKITGKKENVQELLDLMCNHEIGRVDNCDYNMEAADKDDIISVIAHGDCSWSVLCSMLSEYVNPSLESQSERLNLVIEIYSKEIDTGFQEHYLIDRGKILVKDCREDYQEYYVRDYASIEEFNKDNETDFTEDMVDKDGYIIIGGFGNNYGKFQDFDDDHFKSGTKA